MFTADEPSDSLTEPRELLVEYLDWYRDTLLRKIDGLSDEALRGSELPSGWTPLELVKHLAFVERRWLQWGFAARPVDEPWGDNAPGTERWHVGVEESTGQVIGFFRECCDASREIVEAAELSEVAAIGGRFGADRTPPTLSWILFHVLQEYARHVGQLDVVRELLDGAVGE
ncbi:MAG: DinB family protein [Jatrophihabitans sp.]